MLVDRVLPAALLVTGIVALGLVLHPAFEPTPPLAVSVHGGEVVVVTAKPSVVRLEYGPSRSYGLFSASQGPVKRHSFELASLAPGTTYHLRALAAGAHGTQTSADATLTAPARVEVRPLPEVPPLAWIDARSARGGLALRTFAPALAAPTAPVTLENQDTDVYATRRNGAVTIFALNTSPAKRVYQVFYVPGLAGRSVRVWGSATTIEGTNSSFADTLPPYAWRVYVVPPR